MLEAIGDKAPVPRDVWVELAPEGATIDESFLAFMEQWGGHALYEVEASVGQADIETFLADGDRSNTARWEHSLLDDDLKHFLPFARNGYGGRFLLNSQNGAVYYANLDGHEDEEGGQVAANFDEFLELIVCETAE